MRCCINNPQFSGFSAGGRRDKLSNPNFWLSKNFILAGKFASKNSKFWAETPVWGKFVGKIGIMISSVANLQCLSVLEHCNLLPSVLLAFFTHGPRLRYSTLSYLGKCILIVYLEYRCSTNVTLLAATDAGTCSSVSVELLTA